MTPTLTQLSTQSLKMRLHWAWRKWRALVGMFVQDGLAYKANLIIWILTDAVTATVMPLIWLASYNGRGQIQGFSPSDMVLYYLVLLGLTGFIQSHVMWDMAGDVKSGKFNSYLIRPLSFMTYMLASNLGWRVMRTLLTVPLLALVAFGFRHYLPDLGAGHYHIGPVFWLAVVLGHLVSFTLSYALGLLALWLYEVRSLFNFYYLPLVILSGQLAPLALLPSALTRFALWTPFPYTLAFPTDIFLGRLSLERIEMGLAAQAVWILISLFTASALWRGGVRRFAAFGI